MSASPARIPLGGPTAKLPSDSVFRIEINKDRHKFGCAHWTFFAPDPQEAGKEDGPVRAECERLHGHNYYIRVYFHARGSLTHGMVLPFDKVKRVLDEACREWDEHIFIAGDSPFQTVSLIGEDQSEVEVVFGPLHGPRRYVFPLSECKILPCDNITSEWLAVLLAQKLCDFLERDRRTFILPSHTDAVRDVSSEIPHNPDDEVNPYDPLIAIAVSVTETKGQTVTYECPVPWAPSGTAAATGGLTVGSSP